MTLSDPQPKFQGHEVTIDALDVLCAQLMRDPFAKMQDRKMTDQINQTLVNTRPLGSDCLQMN